VGRSEELTGNVIADPPHWNCHVFLTTPTAIDAIVTEKIADRFMESSRVPYGNVASCSVFFRTMRAWRFGQTPSVVQIGNIPAHNSKITENFFEHDPLKRLSRLSYSADISLLDFHRFGKVNRAVIG
jgi:hypothetical protein